MFKKAMCLVLIIVGESMAIYSELQAAKHPYDNRIIWWSFFWVTVAGIFLIPAYVWGIRIFKDIWMVSIASIVSILICEPIVIWLLFRETPSLGSLLGFIFGVIGFGCVVLIK